MSSLTASKLNITQCLRIKGNQYRSSCNRYDYQAEEIEDRLLFLQSREDERANRKLLKEYQMAHTIPPDQDADTSVDIHEDIVKNNPPIHEGPLTKFKRRWHRPHIKQIKLSENTKEKLAMKSSPKKATTPKQTKPKSTRKSNSRVVVSLTTHVAPEVKKRLQQIAKGQDISVYQLLQMWVTELVQSHDQSSTPLDADTDMETPTDESPSNSELIEGPSDETQDEDLLG